MTKIDLKKLSEYLRADLKEVFATKEDLFNLEKKLDGLITTVDGFAKNDKNYSDEIAVVGGRVAVVEDWVKKVAGKIQIPFDQ
jgi:hypothetical protein